MQKMTLPNDVLLPEVGRMVDEGLSVTLMTKGVSMLPFIRGGRDSVVLVKPRELRQGDIVLARTGTGHFVLHRIYGIDGENITLMGDGNVRGQERCTRGDVLAVAVKIIRDGGRETDCTSAAHLRCARLWRALLPVRRYVLAIYRRVIL